MKVAIVCDWLLGIGGAERVVLELHKLYPNAPIYTSQYDPRAIDWFKDADVRTTWLQHLPKSFKKFLPVLRALTFSRLNLSDYDLVISSSGAEAKGVKTGKHTIHICYCHSPTQYYWIRYREYLEHPGFGKLDWLARLGLKALVGPMKWWDFRAAQKPDFLVTNSTHTAKQIRRFYTRSAMVVAPPVELNRFHCETPQTSRHGFIVAGRQTPYKRIDLAVAACTQLNLPLTVVGDGPDHANLQAMAGPSVLFITGADDQAVARLFCSAEAFIFPNLDDFGIVAVEALSAGLPVIAYQAGGALDYIQPGKNGLFFAEQTVESLVETLRRYNKNEFDPEVIRKSAQPYSVEKFSHNMREFIAQCTSKK